MDMDKELFFIGHILLAAALGAIIGLERERFVGLAGIRTYATVALGSCLFGLISLYYGAADNSKIAAQIVSGIGFLGAGVIIRDRGNVKGLTTAATLWSTAAIGLTVSLQWYVTAVCGTLIIFCVLALHRLPGWLSWKFSKRDEIEGE